MNDQEDIEKILNNLIDLIELNQKSLSNVNNENKILRKIDLDYLKEFTQLDEYFINDHQEDEQDFFNFTFEQQNLLSNNSNDTNNNNYKNYLYYDLNYTKCDSCNVKTSKFWRKVARNKIVCNSCFFNKTYLIVFDDNYNNNGSNNHKNKLNVNNNNNNNNEDINCLSNENNNNNSSSITNNKYSKFNGYETLNNRVKTKIKVELDEESSLSDATSKSNDSSSVSSIRKSTRNKKIKLNAVDEDTNSDSNATTTATTVSSTNRRTKKFKLESTKPLRCESLVSKITTSDYVFHRGFYMQIGDIVALFDKEDKNTIYFAKIRAFLIDQFGQKSAVITWLIPNNPLHKSIKFAKDFDPSYFSLGPSEEFPRSLDCMEFVCRLVDKNDRLAKSTAQVDSDNANSYKNLNTQYENDILKQKFLLNDLYDKKFKILTKLSYDNGSNNYDDPIEEYQVLH